MKTRMFGINRNLMMAIALGFMTANAFASLPINFATGQDSSGNIQLIGNSLDANWKESNAVSPINPPNSYVVSPNNPDWYSGGNPNINNDTGWFPNGPNSSWIAPNPNDVHGNGNFTLTYTFDLTGYDLTTVAFHNLRWSIDDVGSVQLNGHTEASLPFASWLSFHSFTIPVSDLVQTVNTLTITSTSSDNNFEAARLEGTLSVSPIPEPETYAMLLAGLGLVGFIASRRKDA